MRLLLDTHVLLWWLNSPSHLDPAAEAAISDGNNEIFVSAATIWEVAIKRSIGRLTIPMPLTSTMTKAGLAELPVRWDHARRVARLPDHHRDPFDRVLVAQAIEERLVIVTRDPLVRRYAVPTLAA